VFEAATTFRSGWLRNADPDEPEHELRSENREA